MVKSAKEMLAVLDETKETLFKDRKCTYPYTEWEHKRAQVKERLHRLPKYIHQAVETINIEEQKMGRPPKLDLEKKVNLFILVMFISSHLLIWAQACMLAVAYRGCRSGMLSIKRLQCLDALE